MKFRVGDRVQRKPEYRNRGAWACGDLVLLVEAVTLGGAWLSLQGCPRGWAASRFDLVRPPPLLARDELYMRLRNDAGLSHQHAIEFIAACPGHEEIERVLDSGDTTGEVMRQLVSFRGKNGAIYLEAARRCGHNWA